MREDLGTTQAWRGQKQAFFNLGAYARGSRICTETVHMRKTTDQTRYLKKIHCGKRAHSAHNAPCAP